MRIEAGTCEDGLSEVGVVEVGASEVGVAEVDVVEVGVTEVGVTEVRLHARVGNAPMFPGHMALKPTILSVWDLPLLYFSTPISPLSASCVYCCTLYLEAWV